MFRKLMVGYAPDRHGDDAIALARMLASADPVEEVLIVEAADEDTSADHLDPLTTGWPPHVAVTARVESGAPPDRTLTATADSERADVLILGASHRGWGGRLLKGTTAGSIFPHASWPVVIAPEGYAEASPSLRSVGVGFDGSGESDAAMRWAAGVASTFSAEIRLVAVVQPPPPVETWGVGVPASAWDAGISAQQTGEAIEAMREGVRHELAAARQSLGGDHTDSVVTVGDATHELREAAKDLDLLVVGSHGEGRIAGALMHSVSRGLAHSCPAPLAVVPPGTREPTGA